MNDNILFSNDEVTIRKKPQPDFDYTKVPYSGKDVTNPFIKTNPYWTKDTSGNNVKFFRDEPKYNEGQDFYPDRMYRDEMQARRNFFNSPNFQGSYQAEILNSLSGNDKKRKKQEFIYDVMNYQLKHNPPLITGYTEARPPERPGGIMNYHPVMLNYAAGLAEARQNLFNERYNPRYGLTDAKYNEIIEGQEEPTSWLGYPYGEEEEGASVLEEPGRYTLDSLKESARTFLGDLAFFGDYGSNVVSQALWPYDYEDERGNIYPRGFKDLVQHLTNVSAFEEAGYGVSPEVWADLGYSERKDLQEQFKELTGSDFTYDPTYKPITGGGALTELSEYLGEGPLMPSSDYSDSGVNIYDPYITDDYVNWNPMKSAQLVGHGATGASGIIARRAAKKYLPGLAKYIPSLVKKHPYWASLLGLTIPSIPEPFVE